MATFRNCSLSLAMALILTPACSREDDSSSGEVSARGGDSEVTDDEEVAAGEDASAAAAPDDTDSVKIEFADVDDVVVGGGEVDDAEEEEFVLPEDYDGPTADNPVVYCEGVSASGEVPLIDDFEDQDELLPAQDVRNGAWYAFDDETGGMQELTFRTSDARGARDSGVLHVRGTGFSDWGSGFGFFLYLGEEPCTYDASAHTGVRFWARGNTSVRFGLQNPSVRPVSMGGSCPDDEVCLDSHGVDIPLSRDWTQYEVSFDELTQEGWGYQVGDFTPEEIGVLEWLVDASVDFDIWLDDIEFMGGVSSPGDAGTPMLSPDAAVQVDGGAPLSAGVDAASSQTPKPDAGDAG